MYTDSRAGKNYQSVPTSPRATEEAEPRDSSDGPTRQLSCALYKPHTLGKALDEVTPEAGWSITCYTTTSYVDNH